VFYHLILIWDVEQGKVLRELSGHTLEVNALQALKGGQLLASASEDTTVRIWKVATGECIRIIKDDAVGPILAFRSLPTGQLLFGDTHNKIWIFDPETGQRISMMEGSLNPIWQFQLVYTKPQKNVIRWRQREISPSSSSSSSATSSESSSESSSLGKSSKARSAMGRLLKPFDIFMNNNNNNNKNVKKKKKNNNNDNNNDTSNKNLDYGGLKLISATGHWDSISRQHPGQVLLWDLKTGKKIKVLHEAEGYARAIQGLPGGYVAIAYHWSGFSPSKAQLVIAQIDMEAKEITKSRVVPGGVTKVNAMVLLPDGRLAGARSEGDVLIWNFSGRKRSGEVELSEEDLKPQESKVFAYI